jgi:hypothetical protein
MCHTVAKCCASARAQLGTNACEHGSFADKAPCTRAREKGEPGWGWEHQRNFQKPKISKHVQSQWTVTDTQGWPLIAIESVWNGRAITNLE